MVEFEKEFYSLNELAQVLGIPVSTTHNYKKLFAQWLPTKGRGRRIRYHKDCIKILKYIQGLYEDSMGTQDIEEILSKEYPLVSPQSPAPSYENKDKPVQQQFSPPHIPPEAQSLEIQIPALDKFGDKIEAVFTQLVSFMKESLDENRRLRERLETLEKNLSEMKAVEPEKPSEIISPVSDIPPASKEAEAGRILSKEELKEIVQKMRDEGMSWSKIADELNSQKIVNPNTGGSWQRKSVSRQFS